MIGSRTFLYRLIARVIPETRCFGLKVRLLRWCGAVIGQNVRICSSACFSGPGKLTIGDDVWIGSFAFVATGVGGNVVIGSHVDISDHVLITTGTHEKDANGLHAAGKGVQRSVEIEDGAWIGIGAIILPGVKIGRKAIVGAGAVVNRSCVENTVNVGVPAKAISTVK